LIHKIPLLCKKLIIVYHCLHKKFINAFSLQKLLISFLLSFPSVKSTLLHSFFSNCGMAIAPLLLMNLILLLTHFPCLYELVRHVLQVFVRHQMIYCIFCRYIVLGWCWFERDRIGIAVKFENQVQSCRNWP